MTISALDSATVLTSSSSSTSTSSTTTTEDTLEEDKIEFLELLLVQLENQDPLDPMDVNEWTSQLVSYSQLEQQMEMNSVLSTISDQLTQSSLTTNLSYVGQTVEVDSNASTAQDGQATWAYNIDGTASEVYLTVTDADGNTVWEGEGSSSTGTNGVVLDTSDLDVEDGEALYLYVNASDSDGDSLDNSITSFLTVDGVQSDDDGTLYLTSGELSYTSDLVLKISS